MAFLPARPSRHIAGLVAALLVTLSLSACGDSADSASDSDADTITWGTGVTTMIDSIAFVAMGTGAFKDAGLDVKFTSGPSAPTLLATGKADLIRTRFSDAPLLLSQGQDVKAFTTLAVAAPTGLLGNNDVDSIEDLAAMGDNCTIGAAATGDFYAYPNYWAEKYGLHCKIEVASDYSVTIPGVVSGRYTASPQLTSNAGSAVAKGDAHWLIDPTAPDWRQENGFPYDNVSSIFVANSDYLAEHKDSVETFVKVLKETEEKMKSMSNEEIAEAIKKSGAAIWKPQSTDDLVNQLTGSGQADNVFDLLNLHIGPLTEELYDANLAASKDGNVAVDPDDPKVAFDKAVDPTIGS